MQALELRTLNLDCNFLAYLRNQCYGLRKLNYVFAFDMSVFGRLTAGFSGAVAALGLATSPALAQDDKEISPSENIESVETSCQVTENTISPPDALELSHNCDAVIYFNENVSAYQAEGEARSIRNNEGYNVVAVAGFPAADQIVVLRNGDLAGARTFTQSEMMRGQVGTLIRREMGHPATIQTARLTEASFDN
ncbi:hypothetical protein [Oceanicaulis alexandrii]|uniref:hypothetical protein n=1 Tax=Oceanicaulis alexandrii TaxID=153233 RepID=UPI003B508FF4